MKTLGIIPARLGGKRLRDKVLLAETGKPLIAHVWTQAKKCRTIDNLLVAPEVTSYRHSWTRGPEWSGNGLTDACSRHGMTQFATDQAVTGTDRCAWVAERSDLDYDIVVNIQADQPLLNPAHVDACVRRLIEDDEIDIATVATPLVDDEGASPDVVKVLLPKPSLGMHRNALAFYRNGTHALHELVFRHVGIYAFRREALMHLAGVPQTWPEKKYRLEQYRFMSEQMAVGVEVVDRAEPDVNTREDYDRFVARWRELNPTSSTAP
jgi:3-deoxy-manno-octulosonate cytidylyltransferase (CMP-KDO synthetase)